MRPGLPLPGRSASAWTPSLPALWPSATQPQTLAWGQSQRLLRGDQQGHERDHADDDGAGGEPERSLLVGELRHGTGAELVTIDQPGHQQIVPGGQGDEDDADGGRNQGKSFGQGIALARGAQAVEDGEAAEAG